MNKKQINPIKIIFSILTIALLLAVTYIMAACGPAITVQARAENPVDTINVGFDYASAADIHAFRWNAMAQAYERHGLLNYHDNPDDLSAYRWLAMARAYEKFGLLNEK